VRTSKEVETRSECPLVAQGIRFSMLHCISPGYPGIQRGMRNLRVADPI
jgi:hypothetical protein